MLSKVCEVFTKEYRKETAYQEFTAKMIQYFKLNNNSESVEDKVERLKGKKYVSNFGMNIKNEYEFLRKQVKEKYFNEADEQHKIDGHKICACITGALLKIKLIDFKMNDKVPASIAMSNYAVAFLASNYILYLFLLSDLERW